MEVDRTHKMTIYVYKDVNIFPVASRMGIPSIHPVKRNPCLTENHGLSGKLDITPSLVRLMHVSTKRHKLGAL